MFKIAAASIANKAVEKLGLDKSRFQSGKIEAVSFQSATEAQAIDRLGFLLD